MFKPQKVNQPISITNDVIIKDEDNKPQRSSTPFGFKPIAHSGGSGSLDGSNISLKRPASPMDNNENEIKIEIEDEVIIKQEAIDVENNEDDIDIINVSSVQPPETKKVKNEYYSDNSVSLPGMVSTPGPIGFEPGMFKQEDDNSKSKSDNSSSVKVKFFSYHFVRKH